MIQFGHYQIANSRILVDRGHELCFGDRLWFESEGPDCYWWRRVKVSCEVSHHLPEHEEHQWHGNTRCKSTKETYPDHHPIEGCAQFENAL
jgi:hypothetical protein